MSVCHCWRAKWFDPIFYWYVLWSALSVVHERVPTTPKWEFSLIKTCFQFHQKSKPVPQQTTPCGNFLIRQVFPIFTATVSLSVAPNRLWDAANVHCFQETSLPWASVLDSFRWMRAPLWKSFQEFNDEFIWLGLVLKTTIVHPVLIRIRNLITLCIPTPLWLDQHAPIF